MLYCLMGATTWVCTGRDGCGLTATRMVGPGVSSAASPQNAARFGATSGVDAVMARAAVVTSAALLRREHLEDAIRSQLERGTNVWREREHLAVWFEVLRVGYPLEHHADVAQPALARPLWVEIVAAEVEVLTADSCTYGHLEPRLHAALQTKM